MQHDSGNAASSSAGGPAQGTPPQPMQQPGTYAAAGLEAASVADEVLGTALEAKAKIDKTAGRMQQYHDRIGQYHNKYKDQIKRGDVGGLIKTTGSAIKEGKKAYKTERGNFQDFKKSYAFDTKRGQDMRNHFN